MFVGTPVQMNPDKLDLLSIYIYKWRAENQSGLLPTYNIFWLNLQKNICNVKNSNIMFTKRFER